VGPFTRIHQTLRVNPAMAAGVRDWLWDINNIVKAAGRLGSRCCDRWHHLQRRKGSDRRRLSRSHSDPLRRAAESVRVCSYWRGGSVYWSWEGKAPAGATKEGSGL